VAYSTRELGLPREATLISSSADNAHFPLSLYSPILGKMLVIAANICDKRVYFFKALTTSFSSIIYLA
jgi:hypothetical protein